MNGALKWKLIAGFVLVFVAGGIAGAAFGGFYARHLFFDVHRPGRMADRMKERLRTELRLTPEQVAKVSPIVDKTAAQLRQIRRDTGQRVHELMTEAHKEIAVNLTDEQRQKLQQIQERHRRGRHRHGSPIRSRITGGHPVVDWRGRTLRRLTAFCASAPQRLADLAPPFNRHRTARSVIHSRKECARARRLRRG